MVNSCKEARMHKMFGSYGRNVNTRNGPSVGFTNMNQNKMQGSQWKQYPKYSPQSYGMPNAYYQQYKAAGSNYGNPYPNTMKQPNNNHAQMGLQGQPNNNPPRNAGYGNPGYRYPNPPNYGNYNPYPPRQGSPNYSGNQYYGQNPYPNNNYNHNNYNQVNSNGYNPRYQFNRNPNVQNPSQLNTNARITVKNTGNQQSFKPNQFSSYSNVRNPPVPNNPSRNANQFNSKPNAQGQMLPNNPSHVGKQMRSSPVSGISEANRQPSAKSGSQLPNAEAGKSSVPQSSKMKTRDFPIYGGNPQWASYLNRNAVHRR
ncbi:hypothetical protein ANCCEY_12526 [Ancylostoma ceylanicum]|nr:hypothetical protein ANCCEY_12526 [Ancylostoma ceylanicum]